MQEFLPEDLPDMEPSEGMKKLQQVIADKKYGYIIRCPRCGGYYPNPVPKIKAGGSVILKCAPSKQWRGKRPPVPEGERAEWCGRMFKINVVAKTPKQEEEQHGP